MRRTYTTPPGELLTATPAVALSIIPGATVAQFITAAGLECTVTDTVVAPQLVRYEIRLTDIYKFN